MFYLRVGLSLRSPRNAILISWNRKLLFSLPCLIAVQSMQKGDCKEVPHDLAPETILVEVTESKERFSDLHFAYKAWDPDNTVQPNHSTLKLTVCMIMPLESLLSQCGKYLIGKFRLGESTECSTTMILGKTVNPPRGPVSLSLSYLS